MTTTNRHDYPDAVNFLFIIFPIFYVYKYLCIVAYVINLEQKKKKEIYFYTCPLAVTQSRFSPRWSQLPRDEIRFALVKTFAGCFVLRDHPDIIFIVPYGM